MIRILFGYSAFVGPLYKFYASWENDDSLVNYEFESIHPDYSKKGTLSKEESAKFIHLIYKYEENKSDAYLNNKVDPNTDVIIMDAPTFQFVSSYDVHEFEIDTWQYGNGEYDRTPLLDAINICDKDIELKR